MKKCSSKKSKTTKGIEYYKSKSVEELFAEAFTHNYVEDNDWNPISELRVRGTAEIFKKAKELCSSEDQLHREIGLDVMAQLGHSHKKPYGIFIQQRRNIALEAINDDNPQIRQSAAWVLAHMTDNNERTSYKGLIDLRTCEDAETRLAVAYGLGGITDPEATETLKMLMCDNDNDVRNWATFTLGQINSEQDSSDIRKALIERLSDTFEDVRLEARWGLALRRDPVGIQLLIESLETSPLCGDELITMEILEFFGHEDVSTEELCRGLRNLIHENG